jgi:hypothetical protein
MAEPQTELTPLEHKVVDAFESARPGLGFIAKETFLIPTPAGGKSSQTWMKAR